MIERLNPFLMHEALDRAFIIYKMVEDRLLDHPVLVRNPEWAKKAKTASDELFELYERISEEFLK